MMSTEHETQALTLAPLSRGVRENSARSMVYLPFRQPIRRLRMVAIFTHSHILARVCRVRLDTASDRVARLLNRKSHTRRVGGASRLCSERGRCAAWLRSDTAPSSS